MSFRVRGRRVRKWFFGDSARAFGTLGVLLLALLAIVPAKDRFREWLGYQKEYEILIRGRTDGVALAKRFQSGVQQIWLPERDVTDRCMTCHTRLKETSLAGVGQPFRPHPPIPHSLTEFGCTICHRGQGVATTVEEAHRSTKAWEEPILPAQYSEAGCGQCHRDGLKGTPQLNAGRVLLARYGCVNCHRLVSPEGGASQGTDRPPSLKRIAEKTTREWIYFWIKDPQAWAATATMPNFGLSDADARDVSAFVISQSSPGSIAPAVATNDAGAAAGAELYGESFCASCHAMQNAAGKITGGDLAPDLTRVGSKVRPEWLAAWVKNPAAYLPGTMMPHFRFDEKQIGLLVSYLGRKQDSYFPANIRLEPATAAQIAHGQKLVLEKGCAACHEMNGVARPDNFAPDLTAVGSLPPARVLLAPGVPRTLPDYLAAKIREPHAFGREMKMPRNQFTDAQVEQLVTALLAQTSRSQTFPAALRRPTPVNVTYQPAGRAGQLMKDLRCLSCHSINGTGGSMAPDLTWEGSSVQRAWLLDFLKNPNTLRPVLIRRMPRFNLSNDDASTLADYIMTAYQTPAFDREEVDATKLTPTEASRGKSLFYGKYACNSCHIVDPDNDKGYIGPTLTQAGTRLNAPWIFHWLKNAQALRPGSLELNWNMNDEDAWAITAFLMQQKNTRKPGGER